MHGFDDQPLQIGQDMLKLFRVAAPPGLHGRQHEILSEQHPCKPGKSAHQRRALEHPAAERICNCDISGTHRVRQPRYPEIGILTQFDGITIAVVHAAQNHMDRSQPFECLEPDTVFTYDQVVALDEDIAEIAGKIGMLEIGFVCRSRAQQHNGAFAFIMGGCRSLKRVTHCPEIACQPVCV